MSHGIAIAQRVDGTIVKSCNLRLSPLTTCAVFTNSVGWLSWYENSIKNCMTAVCLVRPFRRRDLFLLLKLKTVSTGTSEMVINVSVNGPKRTAVHPISSLSNRWLMLDYLHLWGYCCTWKIACCVLLFVACCFISDWNTDLNGLHELTGQKNIVCA